MTDFFAGPPEGASPNLQLLDRFFAGACSVQERQTVEGWAAAVPERGETLARMRHRVTHVFAYPAVTSPEVVWERIRPRAGDAQAHIQAGPNETRSRRPVIGQPVKPVVTPYSHRRAFSAVQTIRNSLFAVAAIATIVVLGVGLFRDTHQSFSPTTYKTLPGQRVTVMLDDGIRAVLAPATVLSVVKRPSGIETMVDGEVLFTVVHAAQRPFSVSARNVTARVLGTTFSVRNYVTDSAIRIAVAEGRVGVDSAVLATGEIGMVQRNGHLDMRRDGNVGKLLGWSQGRLMFDGESFQSIIPELERWYGISFAIADASVGRRPLIAEFQDQALSEVLALLAKALGARWERRGETIVFYDDTSIPAR